MAWKHSNNDPNGPYGRGWKRLRLKVLKRDKYLCQCEDCTLVGVRRPATEVDHKVRVEDGGTNDMSNLQAINSECHERKTKRDGGAQPSYGCDESGLPLDPRHPWAIQQREAMQALKVKHGRKRK